MSDLAQSAGLATHFRQAMSGFDRQGPLAVAVSGGPDSMALLALAHNWAKGEGVDLVALTVDHRLRAAAAAEAALVADWCATHNISHHTLVWEKDGAPCGNLQAAARVARYELMGAWCVANKVGAVAVAHHADDQAETVLMRLGRGSGVDGLAAMAASAPWPVVQAGAPRLLRPLLKIRRADLLVFGEAQGLPMVQDPSNQDTNFDRVATRQAITALDLDVGRLARTADLMGQEKAALEWAVDQAMAQVATVSPHGFIALDRTAFSALPAALGTRLLRHILQAMGTSAYPPRKEALERMQRALQQGQSHTLAGVSLSAEGVVCPEYLPKAADLPVGEAFAWDQRFSFAAHAAGWRVVARAEVAAQQLSDAQMTQISVVPAAARPYLPVLVGPDARAYLPSYGENSENVSVLGRLKGILTMT